TPRPPRGGFGSCASFHSGPTSLRRRSTFPSRTRNSGYGLCACHAFTYPKKWTNPAPFGAVSASGVPTPHLPTHAVRYPAPFNTDPTVGCPGGSGIGLSEPPRIAARP